MIKGETAKWGKIVKDANIRLSERGARGDSEQGPTYMPRLVSRKRGSGRAGCSTLHKCETTIEETSIEAQSSEFYLDYLNGPDVAALALTDDEILAAVEAGLDAQGRGETVIEPRMHLVPGAGIHGHFNVLRGYVAPLALAGVKVVGDFVDNYQQRAAVGDGSAQPVRSGDRAAGRDHRRRRSHRHAHRRGHRDRRQASRAQGSSRMLGHIGARGTAYWNVRLLDQPLRLRRDPRPLAHGRRAATRSRERLVATTSASP